MNELTAFRVFSKVAELGSFSEAGRRLGNATSSVIRQVNHLEDTLGVRLLTRTTRQLALTEAGQRFLQRANSVIEFVDEAKREASAYQKEARGELRVHVGVAVGEGVILPALPRFMERYPEISLDITVTDARVDIVAERVDLAIWRGRLEDSSLIARPLTEIRRCLCASPHYFKCRERPQTPQDLAHHNCLVYSGGGYTGEWTFTRSGEAPTVILAKGNLTTYSASALLHCAVAGQGITVLPTWLMFEASKRGELEIIFPDHEISLSGNDPSLNLVYPYRSPPPKVAAFMSFAVDLFRSRA